MQHLTLICLLLYGFIHTAQTGLRSQNRTEGQDISILCVNKEEVIWSKDVRGNKANITTVTKKGINPDPHKKYSVLSDLSLWIKNLTLSDSGIYYCNGDPVLNLTVTSLKAVYYVESVENSIATLPCGNLTKGNVTWSRDINGQKKDLLTCRNGKVTKHISDPHKRYKSRANVALIISRVSLSDAGKYYCSGNTVELQVIPKRTTTSAATITTEPTSANKLQNTSTTQISIKLSSRKKETVSRATPVTNCSNMATAETGGKQDKGTTSERERSSTDTEDRDNLPAGVTTTSTKGTTELFTEGSMNSTTVNKAKDTIIPIVSLSVGVGGVALVVVSLLLWRCCVQTKSAKASKNDHVYESVEHLATSTPPACEKQCGGIYVLAGDPAVLNLVKKNQSDDLPSQTQSSEKLMEPMYYTIQADEQTTSDV